jgi:hypothetical protein
MVSPTSFERKSSPPQKSPPRARRLGLENLEDRRLLTADPGWLATIGGQRREADNAVAVDAIGDVYVAGQFSETVDFDPGVGVSELTAFGAGDGFVAKYTSSGALVWARRMGGLDSSARDSAGAIALGPDGFVYATGRYSGGGDFDGDGLAEQPNRGGWDLFVTKLVSDSGNEVWTKTFGGDHVDGDLGGDLAIASDGSLFITGNVRSSTGTVDIDPGAEVASISTLPYGAIFVLKLDTSGNYVTSFANIPTDVGALPNIAVDASGVYLGGVYRGTVDFDSGPGQAIREPYLGGNDHDAFVARYSQQGDFGWVRTLRGTTTLSQDWVNAIAIDANRVYVGGTYVSGLDLNDDNVADLPGNQTSDIFVASYAKVDGTMTWAEKVGTSVADDAAWLLGLDGTGALLVYGYFSGTVDFDPGPGVHNLSTLKNLDNYSWKLNAATGTYLDAARLEGFGVNAVTVDSGGMMYLAGSFNGTAVFPNGSVKTSADGPFLSNLVNDGFVLKLNPAVPRVAITSPISGQQLIEGGTASFTGTAIDDQDGNLTSGLVWQSQSGTLGTGGNVGPVTLSVGAHVITAQATGTDGLVGSSGVSVLVNPKAPTNLTGTVSGSNVTLNWQDKSNAETGYRVERAVKPGNRNWTPQWSVITTLGPNITTYANAPGTGNWLYRVQATATGVASAYSNQASVSVKKTGATSLSLTAEPQTTTATDSGVSSSASLPASSTDSTSQPTAPALLLAPTKSSAKSKLADAALAEADDNWLDGALEDDLLVDLVAAS